MSTHTQHMMTVADLERTPDDLNRYELIEGEIIVSRSPGLTHQDVLVNLLTILVNHLAQHQIGKVFLTPGVILDNFNCVIPDIVFASNSRRKEIATSKHITGVPELVIEIVSPGSVNARRDRIMKRQVYGKHGVLEYWIVDPLKQSVEIYRMGDGSLNLFETVSHDQEITSPFFPGLIIAANTLYDSESEI